MPNPLGATPGGSGSVWCESVCQAYMGSSEVSFDVMRSTSGDLQGECKKENRNFASNFLRISNRLEKTFTAKIQQVFGQLPLSRTLVFT